MTVRNEKKRGITLEALQEKKTGPPPSGRKWRGLPVPSFFNEESANHFTDDLEVLPDDVFLSCAMKSGTSWLHTILAHMLYGIDDDGNKRQITETQTALLTKQVYPDILGKTRPKKPHFLGGLLSYPDIVSQPSPRLFTTHFYGDYLPKSLTEPTPNTGSGRLIVCLRNPKDVLTSLHFFRGEAKDGWYGNEHGPGSLVRFCSPNCANAYGSYFGWVKETEKYIQPLVQSGRCIVIYYEEMIDNLSQSLDKIATFLGQIPLTDAKREAIMEAATLESMSHHFSVRKGEVGDWKNHLDTETWSIIDKTAEENGLNENALYKPLLKYTSI